MINYAAAGQYAEWVHALAIVESNEQPGKIGDGGRAFGILQQHPPFFMEYAVKDGAYPIAVDDDWDTAQIKAAARFLEVWEHLGLDLCIQAYNLGATAVLKGARNTAYLQRWHDAMNAIHGSKQ